jgi:predicted MFS family arabinose efflux permease
MVRFDETRKRTTAHSVKDRRALWQDLIAGFRYVRRRPRVSSLLTIAAVTSLFGAPYLTLIPIFARDIFHLGASGLAWMMGMAGAGAFCGALFLTYLGDFRRKGWFVLGGSFGFGVFLIAFAQADVLMVSLAFLFGVGFTIVTAVALINTLLQQLVTDEMRGRVMSMFILSFIGTMPLGNLLAGSFDHRFGAPATLTGGGICIIVYVTISALRNRKLRELH